MPFNLSAVLGTLGVADAQQAYNTLAAEYDQQYQQAFQEFVFQQQQYHAPDTPTPGQPQPQLSYPGTPYIQQQQLPDLPPDILAKLEEMLKLRARGVDPAPVAEPPVGERGIALGGLEP